MSDLRICDACVEETSDHKAEWTKAIWKFEYANIDLCNDHKWAITYGLVNNVGRRLANRILSQLGMELL